ncbi:MAG: protein-(glutamine-N5) methyltransferase, release factor-specific [Verrucomicrobia bacterium GWF2_51_19]|nr:MAG: protein-(glutamine-N5) methyltransferase, release factor-specific [Verrucomicrobia bacterium GWF2_51_19]
MTTLLIVLEKTKRFLADKGVPSARVDAEWLFAHVLNCKRLDLYLQYEKELDESVLGRLRELVKRRAQREPLQHIIGHCDFHGLRFKSDARALIPRPETEELVALLCEHPQPASILDLGTGTGAIALSLAKHFPHSDVLAIDKSREALSLASENAAINGLERVRFEPSDWFESVRGTFDWIVANPPYLSEEEWLSAEPEVRSHDPQMALVAAHQGLADLAKIVTQARTFLNPNGLLALEMGIHHADALLEIARPLYATAFIVNDLSRRPRFLLAKDPL